MFDDMKNDVDLVVAPAQAQALATSVQFSAKVRELGFSCEIYPGFDKLAKQFKYANERNAHYVAVFGEDELANGTVTIKDMVSGEQKTAPIDAIYAADGKIVL